MLVAALVTALGSSLGLELLAQDDLPPCAKIINGCNCDDEPGKDFKSWQEAQRVLEAFPGDPHDLDRDNDGYACDIYSDAPAAAKNSSQEAPAASPGTVTNNPPPSPAASPGTVANNPPPPPTTSPNPTTSEKSESSSAVPALW